jgi:ABC-type branched-subunit amino acid transport system substrate-binding protein
MKKAKMEKGTGSACFASACPENIWSLKEMRPVLSEFRKRFKAEDMYMPYVFDAGNLVMKLLAEGKKSGQDMISALKETVYDGATGSIKFNKAGIRVNANSYFFIVRGREVLHRKLNDTEGRKYWGAK